MGAAADGFGIVADCKRLETGTRDGVIRRGPNPVATAFTVGGTVGAESARACGTIICGPDIRADRLPRLVSTLEEASVSGDAADDVANPRQLQQVDHGMCRVGCSSTLRCFNVLSAADRARAAARAAAPME